jgi:hypothetical protein
LGDAAQLRAGKSIEGYGIWWLVAHYTVPQSILPPRYE